MDNTQYLSRTFSWEVPHMETVRIGTEECLVVQYRDPYLQRVPMLHDHPDMWVRAVVGWDSKVAHALFTNDDPYDLLRWYRFTENA